MKVLNRTNRFSGENLVGLAITAVGDPTSVKLLPRRVRTQVLEVAKALEQGATVAKGPTGQRHAIPAQAVAQRAHRTLGASVAVTPVEIENALRAQGLDNVEPFSPGTPLAPYYGYSRRPRNYNYQIERNVTTETRPDRLPFYTIKQLYESYDVAQICTRHAINDLRSMRLRFEPMEGYTDNPVKEIAEARRILRRPDKVLSFPNWLAKHAMDVWRYDAGTIYRQRDKAGNVISLPIVDGTTIMPILDYYGDRPTGEAPAYNQMIMGIPWVWLEERDLVYEPMWPLPESPYGVAPLETILINANTDVRLQMYFLDFFTKGMVPEAIAIAPEDAADPDAIEELQETYDDWTYSDQSQRWGLRWLPNGTELKFYKPDHFDPDVAEYVMRRTVAAFGMVPSNLGFTENVNKASSDTQMDVQFRVGTSPNTIYYEGLLDSILQDDFNLPVQVRFDTGREKEDRLMEAQAHQIYVQLGAESPDEVRDKILGYPINPEEKIPRFFDSLRLGPVPISYLLSISGEVDPLTGAPLPGSVQQRDFVVPGAMTPDPLVGAPTPAPALPARTGATPPKAPARKGLTGDQENLPLLGEVGPTQEGDKDGYGHPLVPDVVKEDLARWRTNSRKRVAQGKSPRHFLDSAIPSELYHEIWKSLSQAQTREEVDASFVSKITTYSNASPNQGMISLDLDPSLIPLVPGGVESPHITLAFLGDEVDKDLFIQACDLASHVASRTSGPLVGVLDGQATFPPPPSSSSGLQPFYLIPHLLGVDKLHEQLKSLDQSNFPVYVPHVCLGYRAPDEALPPPPSHPIPIECYGLSVHWGDQVRFFRFKLGNVTKGGPPQWSDFHRNTDKIVQHYTPLIEKEMAESFPWDSLHDIIKFASEAKKAVSSPTAASPVMARPLVPSPLPGGTLGGVAGVPATLGGLSAGAIGAGVGGIGIAGAVGASATLNIALAGLLTTPRAIEGLKKVWIALYCDAFVQGAFEAMQNSGGVLPSWMSILNLPAKMWTKWKPGMASMVASVNGKGLYEVLQDADKWITEVLTTQIHRVQEAVRNAVASGNTHNLEDILRSIIEDLHRAWLISETEYSRAYGAGLMTTYQHNHVAELEWLHVPGACARCMANVAASPQPAKFPLWPSGPLPVHPGERCSIAPYNGPERNLPKS